MEVEALRHIAVGGDENRSALSELMVFARFYIYTAWLVALDGPGLEPFPVRCGPVAAQRVALDQRPGLEKKRFHDVVPAAAAAAAAAKVSGRRACVRGGVCARVVRIPAELKAEVHHDLAHGHTRGCAELNATAPNPLQIRQGKA